jgi:hypothetical protein
MSRRGWSAVAIGIAVAIGLAAPAGAAETTFDDTCADVYGHRPVGDLDKTTDPAAGNTVMSGQSVEVTLTWPTFAVAGERRHRIMECLSIDGGTPRLWAEKQFTSSSGTVTLSTVVPDNVAAKSTVCGQSFLKTRGSFGPVSRWSEKTCFPAAAAKDGKFQALSRGPSSKESSSPQPENRSTPTTRGPLFSAPPNSSPPKSAPSSPPGGSGDYQPPWPPWEKAPRASDSTPVASTTTTLATTKPRKAQGSQSAAPVAAPTRAPSQALPRTGAGVVVLLGVAGVALFSGRTLRKTAHHIEDSMPVDAVPVDDDEPTLVLGRRW